MLAEKQNKKTKSRDKTNNTEGGQKKQEHRTKERT